MPFLTTKVIVSAVATVVGVLALIAVYSYVYTKGYKAHQLEMAEASAKAEKERRKDDARISKMDDYSLCREYLIAQRLPIDVCEQLRGVHGE